MPLANKTLNHVVKDDMQSNLCIRISEGCTIGVYTLRACNCSRQAYQISLMQRSGSVIGTRAVSTELCATSVPLRMEWITSSTNYGHVRIWYLWDLLNVYPYTAPSHFLQLTSLYRTWTSSTFWLGLVATSATFWTLCRNTWESSSTWRWTCSHNRNNSYNKINKIASLQQAQNLDHSLKRIIGLPSQPSINNSQDTKSVVLCISKWNAHIPCTSSWNAHISLK